MQENMIVTPGKSTKERALNRTLFEFIVMYNKDGNLIPPKKESVESLTQAINVFYSGTNKNIQVYYRHEDLPEGKAHFTANISINGKTKFSFDPNGTHNPDDLVMLNRTNLHKPNNNRQGECGLWCVAAAVEISKEINEGLIINKSESKELTRRIAARFINLKQTMLNPNEFISLGDNLDNDTVSQFIGDGKNFIEPKGWDFLNDKSPAGLNLNGQIKLKQTLGSKLPPLEPVIHKQVQANVSMFSSSRMLKASQQTTGTNKTPEKSKLPKL